MVEIGNIVTLDNGKNYLLLEIINREGIDFVYAVRTTDNDEITNEYLIFEVIKEEGDEYLRIVDDKELYDLLFEEFKDVVIDKIMNEAESDEEEAN